MSLKHLFERTELILLIAIVLPLLIAVNVTSMKSWLEIILGIVMFLSIRPFFKKKQNLKQDWKKVLISISLNYVLLSFAYLLLASIFFPLNSDLYIGYILLAIVPPAVSIVPLCYLTKCDIKVADKAIFLGYLLSLIIIPVSSYLIFGKNFDFLRLTKSLLIIILIPTLLAYFSRKVESKVFDYTKVITGLLIGLIVFITVSLNRSLLLDIHNPDIIKILIVNLIVIFSLGLIVYYVSKRLVPKGDAIDFTLYATQKNEATGIAIALVLFNSTVAIPLVFSIVIQFLFFIVLEKWVIKE